MLTDFKTITADISNEDFWYDGFYFSFSHPNEEDEESTKDPLSYFKVSSDTSLTNVPSEKHSLGNTFLMAFLQFDDDGIPTLDETVEAVLADPVTYVQNLQGTGLFGCIVRKTPRGEAWFDKHYLQNAIQVIDNAKKQLKLQH